MNIIEGTFKYILRIAATTGNNAGNVHTMLDGKFKVKN